MKRISTGSPFEAKMGYSRAIVKGNWCFVSGVTGYDYKTMVIPESIAIRRAIASPLSVAFWPRRALPWRMSCGCNTP